MSMQMTGESEMSKNDIDSPSSDDGGNVGENSLKKGPWTSAEDEILFNYVMEHGEGNWNAVQKHTGLLRCGKSCRLRWANHLRPDLKKGAFSKEEEDLIINLHAKMGNRWAQMAAKLPGRTDNEIKNYWNTRIKRRQRAGLSVYPPDIDLKALAESQQIDEMGGLASGKVHNSDSMPINNIEIPTVIFKTRNMNHLTYPPAFLDTTASSLLPQGPHLSYPGKSLLSTVDPAQCYQWSESLNPCLSSTTSEVISRGSQYLNESYAQDMHSLIHSGPYDHNLTTNQASPSILYCSNAFLHGNPSSSEPDWATKPELPSVQSQGDYWGSPSSPLPPLECVDNLIQTPPTEHTLSCHVSPHNSGLLDEVLHESQTKTILRDISHHQSSNASDMIFDETDTWYQLIHDTLWESYGDPNSHLRTFNECTPISGNLFDEPKSLLAIPAEGSVFKEGEVDELLATDYCEQDHMKNDTSMLKDAGETPLDDDLSWGYKVNG